MTGPKKVEVKTTVAGDAVATAMAAMHLSLGDSDSTTSLILFCDALERDGSLALRDRDLIVRLRWRLRVPSEIVNDVSNDVTVKVRPATGDPSRFTASRRKGEKDKFEGDWSPSKEMNSFSRRVEGVDSGRLGEVIAGRRAAIELLSSGQLALIREVLGHDLPVGLRCLPPVLATTWNVEAGRTIELWSVRDLHFVEISERADVGPQDVRRRQLEFVRNTLGVEPDASESKTSTVLAALIR